MLFGISPWTLSIQIKHSASTWSITWVEREHYYLYLLEDTLFSSSLTFFSCSFYIQKSNMFENLSIISQSHKSCIRQKTNFSFLFVPAIPHPRLHQQPAVSIQTLSSSCVLGWLMALYELRHLIRHLKSGAIINFLFLIKLKFRN